MSVDTIPFALRLHGFAADLSFAGAMPTPSDLSVLQRGHRAQVRASSSAPGGRDAHSTDQQVHDVR